MLFLGLLLVITIVFGVMSGKIEYKHENLAFTCGVVALVSGLALASSLIIIPCNQFGGHASVQEYYAFKETVKESRGTGTEMERAAIQGQIADWNEYIASTKYWNGTMFDIFICDAVAELEPLR